MPGSGRLVEAVEAVGVEAQIGGGQLRAAAPSDTSGCLPPPPVWRPRVRRRGGPHDHDRRASALAGRLGGVRQLSACGGLRPQPGANLLPWQDPADAPESSSRRRTASCIGQATRIGYPCSRFGACVSTSRLVSRQLSHAIRDSATTIAGFFDRSQSRSNSGTIPESGNRPETTPSLRQGTGMIERLLRIPLLGTMTAIVVDLAVVPAADRSGARPCSAFSSPTKPGYVNAEERVAIVGPWKSVHPFDDEGVAWSKRRMGADHCNGRVLAVGEYLAPFRRGRASISRAGHARFHRSFGQACDAVQWIRVELRGLSGPRGGEARRR